jgi:hypothetical protein
MMPNETILNPLPRFAGAFRQAPGWRANEADTALDFVKSWEQAPADASG